MVGFIAEETMEILKFCRIRIYCREAISGAFVLAPL